MTALTKKEKKRYILPIVIMIVELVTLLAYNGSISANAMGNILRTVGILGVIVGIALLRMTAGKNAAIPILCIVSSMASLAYGQLMVDFSFFQF